MILYGATTNPGKIREFNLIAAHYAGDRIEVRALPSAHGIEAPEETGQTFEANAILKAEHYSRHLPELVFADDSGLAVDALNGAPGIYSARYAGEAATDAANNAKLLAALANEPNRTARFICAIAVARNGKVIATFEDQVEGQIITEPRGPNGFGYDPLFYFEPFGTTFGEATPAQKLLVSHRGKAMHRMIEYLLTTPALK